MFRNRTLADSAVSRLKYVGGSRFRFAAVCVATIVMTGCQATAPGPASSEPEPVASTAWRKSAATHFSVDPQRSELRLLVYREGSLAELGHNHVMVGRIAGDLYLGDSTADSGFRLCVPVESFQVDAEAARAEEGSEFEATVPDAARAATRKNMMGEEVLNATAYPVLEVVSQQMAGPMWNPDVTALLSIAGESVEWALSAALVEFDDELVVTARSSIRQTDFGLEPYSVLGGNLRVRDRIEIRARIVARKTDSAETALECESRSAPT